MSPDLMRPPRLESLFLIGPMGSGKTTVGRHLAELLQWPFIDSDHELELRTGASIPWIFEKEGEAGFRQREAALLAELTQRRHVVLATGGGAVLNPQTRACLQQLGTTVYLRAPVEIQLARIGRDRNRPLLQTPDPYARLAALLSERDPLYQAAAHLIVDVDQGLPRDMAEQILARLA